MVIEMLKPTKIYSDKNDQSLIMKVTLEGHVFLFTGDISKEVDKDIYQKYGKIDIDFLKLPHHGSASSTSPLLLEMTNPKVAMIGVGKNNLYKHPSYKVIERLERKQIMILRTDLDGMFHIRFMNHRGYIFK